MVLNQTAFYPNSGGQLFDTGTMQRNDDIFNVVFCGKFSGQISHELDREGLKAQDKVHCRIDWGRRYMLMRMHTAAHILSEVIHKATGALITGNQLGIEQSRIDFSLENYNQDLVKSFVEEANKVISRNLLVTTEFMPRQEALKIPNISKLAVGLPDSIQEFRIVKIGDFDMQADAGTHVRETKEIGKIEFLKVDNKGKNNRRLYFRLV